MKVDYDWKRGSDVLHGSYDYETNVECADKPKGRVVTVLLTFSNPGISRAVVDRLARQTVAWAAPVDAPRVLVVQDDNHHNEFVDDSEYVHQVLQGLGYVATFLQETATGLTAKDVTGYDLVWFSNPGYPMDSKTTFDTLLAFSAAGGGVVLQGDDMAYSWGENFSMSPLTHVDFGDNGTSACGVSIDNNAGNGSYRVTFEEGTHPIVSGLSGQTFLYGDDIDRSTPRHEGESVLATAVPVDPLGAPLCVDTRPVIVAFDPPK